MKFEWQRTRATVENLNVRPGKSGIGLPLSQPHRGIRKADFRLNAVVLTVTIMLVAFNDLKISAQDAATNAAPAIGTSADDIKALRQKIEELERKVKDLEERNKSEAQTDKDKAQTDELEQKVKILERNRELDVEAAETKAKEAPKITIGSDGFSFGNADGSYVVQLKGVLQVDSRTFIQDAGIVGNDGFLLRRARPVLQGTVARDFDFLFVPDFGGSSVQIFDAYLNYRYLPELQLRAGKMKSPIGLEQLQADVDIFFNERSLVTDLLPNRDLGIVLQGEILGGVASYAAGIFNGLGDGRSTSNFDFEDDKAFEGRLFFQPFKTTSIYALQGFGFGLGGSYETMQRTNTTGLPATTGGTLPGFVTDGQQQFFAYNPAGAVVVANGEHWRLSPQAYYYCGPFGFLGEYIISDQRVTSVLGATRTTRQLANTAWQVTGSWILTGEDAAYKGGVVPRHPFHPLAGGWGALQLVGRYEQLDIDDDAFPLFSNPATSATFAAAWSVGLNWYLNRNFLIKASFSHTDFKGGGGPGASAPAAVTRNDENVFFTRMQLAF
jgi:phosphate-selective porin OprO/OprP